MKGTAKIARPESFESWCRRNRVAPGDPTPAVSSPGARLNSSGKAFSTTLKGPDTMPALKTTLEIFCLRTGRVFSVRASAVRSEPYMRWLGTKTPSSRELVACKHCPDTHLLLNPSTAASFGLLGDPIEGQHLTHRDRSHFRGLNRPLFDRKKFPPLVAVEEAA